MKMNYIKEKFVSNNEPLFSRVYAYPTKNRNNNVDFFLTSRFIKIIWLLNIETAFH